MRHSGINHKRSPRDSRGSKTGLERGTRASKRRKSFIFLLPFFHSYWHSYIMHRHVEPWQLVLKSCNWNGMSRCIFRNKTGQNQNRNWMWNKFLNSWTDAPHLMIFKRRRVMKLPFSRLYIRPVPVHHGGGMIVPAFCMLSALLRALTVRSIYQPK